jgi:hypothetical protein
MVEGAWAASAGGGVTLVARWHRRVTTDETGSSGTCGRGRATFFSSRSSGFGSERERVGRGRWMGEATESGHGLSQA